jgi:hypothetical protein
MSVYFMGTHIGSFEIGLNPPAVFTFYLGYEHCLAFLYTNDFSRTRLFSRSILERRARTAGARTPTRVLIYPTTLANITRAFLFFMKVCQPNICPTLISFFAISR